MPKSRFPPLWALEQQDAYFVVRDQSGQAPRSATPKSEGSSMRKRKNHTPSDWPFTLECIGRELQNVYPAGEKLPEHLRELAKGLERQTTTSRRSCTDEEGEIVKPDDVASAVRMKAV
jgi:hypothetical protein